jgi:hypothetical protein
MNVDFARLTAFQFTCTSYNNTPFYISKIGLIIGTSQAQTANVRSEYINFFVFYFHWGWAY